MEFDVIKRIFLFDDTHGSFQVERKIICTPSGRELMRLVCIDASMLLKEKHFFETPTLFSESFQLLQEALANQVSPEMVELLSLFAGLRKTAKRIVIWDLCGIPEQISELAAFVGQKHRRFRCF